MPAKASLKDQRMRMRLAQEAARIVLEEGIGDLHRAKHKAAARLGAADTRNLPANQEIEAEIQARQRLFEAATHANTLAALRRDALEAMRLLQRFNPRLIGSVAKGTAGRHSSIQLLLYCDSPESVGWTLDDAGIPADPCEHALRFGGDDRATAFPAYCFMAGEHSLELIVLPERRHHQVPLGGNDGQAMAWADIRQLQAMIQLDAPPDQSGLAG